MAKGYSVRHYGRARTKKNGRKYKDWYVIVSLDGKEIETTRANPNTEAAAKRLRDKKGREFYAGSYIATADDMTFEEVAREHYAYFVGQTQGPNANRSERSTRAQEGILRNHLLPRFGHLRLTQVATLLPAYIDEIKQHSPSGTVNRRWEAACAVFRYSQKKLGLPDLLQNVHVELPKKRIRSSDEIIKYEEFKSLLAYLDERPEHMTKLDWLQNIVMVCLAGLMGLRIGEIAGADCEDMDLENWRVRVDRQQHPGGKIADPKHNSKRGIDMDAITHMALTDYREFLGDWSGPLFRGVFGKRIGTSAAGSRILDVIVRAGFVDGKIADGRDRPKYSPHILRHFAGSFWISQGVPVDRVSRQLGHRSYDFTHKTYIHDIEAYENRGRVVMQALGNAFPGSRVSLPPPAEAQQPLQSMRDITPPSERVVRLSGPRPEVRIPPNAPQWLSYAVRLLAAGWTAPATSRELGFNEFVMYRWFKTNGLPPPDRIRTQSGHHTNQGRKRIERTNTDKSALSH
jgi:integrase